MALCRNRYADRRLSFQSPGQRPTGQAIQPLRAPDSQLPHLKIDSGLVLEEDPAPQASKRPTASACSSSGGTARLSRSNPAPCRLPPRRSRRGRSEQFLEVRGQWHGPGLDVLDMPVPVLAGTRGAHVVGPVLDRLPVERVSGLAVPSPSMPDPCHPGRINGTTGPTCSQGRAAFRPTVIMRPSRRSHNRATDDAQFVRSLPAAPRVTGGSRRLTALVTVMCPRYAPGRRRPP
jgi:hypothetical protein